MDVVDAELDHGASYAARLARTVLDGGPAAAAASIRLLEIADPPTLTAALAVVGRQGDVRPATFDCMADAWERHRHMKHLAWD